MSIDLKHRYRTLFFETLKISAGTFGGGFVIVPLMKRKFVDELNVIEEQEMLDLVSIAQSCPGPIAVNGAILVGYKVGGVRGGLISLLGTIIPPIVIISVISFFYQAFRDNRVISTLMAGMLCGVAAVVLDVTITMVQGILKAKKVVPLLIMFAAFIAIYFFHVNILIIIAICALIGGAQAAAGRRNR